MCDGVLNLTTITSLGALEPYRIAWERLLRQTPGSCAYQSPQWVERWFTDVGITDQPFVVMMHRGSELVGVAPFALVQPRILEWTGGAVLISAATEPGDYGDPLLAHSDEARLSEALVGHIAAWVNDGRRAVSVRRVDEHGAFYRALCARTDLEKRITSTTASPVTRFSDWSDPDAEIERLAGKLKLPKWRRRLEREVGEISVDMLSPIDVTLDLLARFHRMRFGADDAPHLLQRERSVALLRSAFADLQASGAARTCRLSAGGRVVSLEIGHNVASRWVGQAAGFDVELGKYRPGYLLVSEILLAARREGALEYDHGQGVQPYKTHWSTRQRRLTSVVVTGPGPVGDAMRLVQRAVASRRARHLFGPRISEDAWS